MPKMSNPNAERPLSVQDADVEHYTSLGWALVDAPAAKAEPVEKAPAKKTATKKAVTRKSVSKKS